jgi:hypothetical protein
MIVGVLRASRLVKRARVAGGGQHVASDGDATAAFVSAALYKLGSEELPC